MENNNNSSGKVFAIVVGAWLILKLIINLLLGGDFSILDTLVAVVSFICLAAGIMYTNYIVAAMMALIVFIHLPGNLKGILNLESVLTSVFYLVEGTVDICLAIGLCVSQSVKAHFAPASSAGTVSTTAEVIDEKSSDTSEQ